MTTNPKAPSAARVRDAQRDLQVLLPVCEKYLRAHFPGLVPEAVYSVGSAHEGEYDLVSATGDWTTFRVAYHGTHGLGVVLIRTTSTGLTYRRFTHHTDCEEGGRSAIAMRFPALVSVLLSRAVSPDDYALLARDMLTGFMTAAAKGSPND